MKTVANFLNSLKARIAFNGSVDYWERNYSTGGDSGEGSRGKLLQWKAGVINGFIKKNGVKSVIDMGCGDGMQASLIDVEDYIGLDVSLSALNRASSVARDKLFVLYDLTMSLDVIYHIVEDDLFKLYMRNLFGSARKYVVIYSTSSTLPSGVPWVRNRDVVGYVHKHFKSWKMMGCVPQEYPQRSAANFFIYSCGRVVRLKFKTDGMIKICKFDDKNCEYLPCENCPVYSKKETVESIGGVARYR
jgi:hypothetical protein